MRFFNSKIKDIQEQRSMNAGSPITNTLRFNIFGSNNSGAMKLSTVYRCVNLIASSIASLPLIPYTYVNNWKVKDNETDLNNLLNIQPNPFMGGYQFKLQIVTSILLKGDAFIYLKRDNITNEVIELQLLMSDNVLVDVVDGDIKYRDLISGNVYDKSQIVHIQNYGSSFYKGESTIAYMAQTLNIGNNLNNYMSSLSSSGMMVTGILKPVSGSMGTGALADASALKAKESFNNAVNGLTANSVIVLDKGYDFQQISISPKDAKYLESSKLNSKTICQFFNVPPSLAFEELGKYATAEQSQLDFLNNCLQPLIEKIENEFFRKLFLKPDWNNHFLSFDTTNLMRLDAVTQTDVYVKLFNMGAITTNEIRGCNNMQFPVAGGGKAFISTNLQQIDNLIVNQTNSIDNKVITKDNTIN